MCHTVAAYKSEKKNKAANMSVVAGGSIKKVGERAKIVSSFLNGKFLIHLLEGAYITKEIDNFIFSLKKLYKEWILCKNIFT